MSVSVKSVAQNPSKEKKKRGWLEGVSTQAVLTIGQVVEAVGAEFPTLSASKLRFLEDQGLVKPSRGSNGYRLYSEADVQRIRFALASQRDSYMPWDTIRQHLQALDRGVEPPAPTPVARVVATDGRLHLPADEKRVTVRELCDTTGITTEELEEIVKSGLIHPDLSGRFPGRATAVVVSVVQLREYNIEPRHLRSLCSAAMASLNLVDQVVTPLRARKTSADKERANAKAMEVSQLLAVLLSDLLRLGVQEI